MAFKIKEIQERKAALQARRKEIEESFVVEVFNPQAIATSIATSLAAKFILPKAENTASNKESFFYKNVVSRDQSGILSTAYSIISNPIVNGLLIRTRKSWIKWQLFNLGIFLVKKGYDYYKNRQYTDVEIIEEKNLTSTQKKKK